MLSYQYFKDRFLRKTSLARGEHDSLKWALALAQIFNARTKVHPKGNLHPRAKARGN